MPWSAAADSTHGQSEPEPPGLTFSASSPAAALHPEIGEILPLAEAAQAHQHIEDRAITGKIILAS